ncbi:D-isomer specific 2-hydroxyacid dehydrogenase family protein [Forsythia ovata]|uniref:D-isomer specific 2-hydroxyacid dehydrogenase family protein n=1 Tax=Forsythia ovata TaxID=205694 RepID=A0ABD1TQY2_9LAMI
MINKDVMTVLGKDGIIVNIGQGLIIDESELVKFLVEGDLAGAGLDVFENEPSVPKELFGLDNVVFTPHRAALTHEAIFKAFKIVIGNLEAFFLNKPFLYPV